MAPVVATLRNALACGAVVVAACGGGGDADDDTSDASDGSAVDAASGGSAFVQLAGQRVDLPHVEAYLYIYQGTIQLRLNASTEPDFDCFGSQGCTSMYVAIPGDALLGDLGCDTPQVQLIVQRDDAYFITDPPVVPPGPEVTTSCAFTVAARGPVGALTSLADITGVLHDSLGTELVVEGGAIDAVRSDDVTPE